MPFLSGSSNTRVHLLRNVVLQLVLISILMFRNMQLYQIKIAVGPCDCSVDLVCWYISMYIKGHLTFMTRLRHYLALLKCFRLMDVALYDTQNVQPHLSIITCCWGKELLLKASNPSCRLESRAFNKHNLMQKGYKVLRTPDQQGLNVRNEKGGIKDKHLNVGANCLYRQLHALSYSTAFPTSQCSNILLLSLCMQKYIWHKVSLRNKEESHFELLHFFRQNKK